MRVDSDLYLGYKLSPFYDSMLAKIIVCGDTRQEAIRKLRSALGETVIEGITTNLEFLYELAGSKWFADSNSAAINEMLEGRCGV